MDSIIETIYKSCDNKNTGLVPVLILIEFIKPFMPNNLSELVKLQTQLDPDNTNPSVSFSLFQRVMSDWIAKIQVDDANSSLSEFPVSFSQNASHTRSDNNNTTETALEEQVCNLKHQLAKITTERDLVKQQLAVCEEQNESLVAKLNAAQKPKQRTASEQSFDDKYEDEMQEEAISDKNKCEQLRKMLSISEKQQEIFLTQIEQLENENQTLKNKLQFFEKSKLERRRSISEMRDCIDIKETEISTLMEVIQNLKCDLDEKTDLLNFYTNEHELLKQRAQELEVLLNNSSCHDAFNTPKLLKQIAHPITPLNMKEFDTSSPVKELSSISSDFFDIDVMTTVLRSPHKTLRDELSEISKSPSLKSDLFNIDAVRVLRSPRIPKETVADELERLQTVVRQQEDIKNSLWQNMKLLSTENAELRNCRKEYHDLVANNQEQDMIIANLTVAEHDQKTRAENLLLQIVNVETNLNNQKFVNASLRKNADLINNIFNEHITQVGNELLTMKAIIQREKLKNKILRKKLTVRTTCQDKNTETDFESHKQTVTEVKRPTNFDKQQIKIERLAEKCEIIEKKLATEKGINTKLELKCQELLTECKKLEENLKFDQEKICRETEIIKCLQENKACLERENVDSQLQVVTLRQNVEKLTNEKRDLDEKVSGLLRTISILQTETFSQRCLLDKKLKEELMLKKQLFDLNTIHTIQIQQLQNELREKSAEIELTNKSNINELKSAIFDTMNNIRFEDSRIRGVLQGTSQDLSENVQVATLLLRNLSDMYLSLVNEKNSQVSCEKQDDIPFDEDSFLTCSSEITFGPEQVANIIPLKGDSFLETINFNDVDLRTMSRKEMEEKFTTLALMLSVDSKSTTTRCVVEEKKFNDLVMKFFSYLNYTIDLLSMNASNKVHKTATSYLQLLKDVGEDMLKSAAERGVLQFENRTATCWKLVINYVAILNRENKEMKQTVQDCNKSSIEKNLPVDSLSWFQKGKLCVCSFSLIVVTFVVMFVLYVDQLCPKNGKRTCPVQWIKNFFIEKTYSPDFQL